jgi:Ca-activated chloride channel family protein
MRCTLSVLSFCFSLGVGAGAAACDLALIFAVDVSGSVDTREYRIQMEGLAAGLRDPVVSEALVRARAQLLLLQWTGAGRQDVSIPWQEMRDFGDVEAMARTIEAGPRRWRNFSTAIGEALSVAASQFAPVAECRRKVIDLSGDGPSNEGPAPPSAKPLLSALGVTVNALAIEESEPELTAYFYENVIHGEGAFVITAAGFEDYPDRIRRKLMRETTRQTAAALSHSDGKISRPNKY